MDKLLKILLIVLLVIVILYVIIRIALYFYGIYLSNSFIEYIDSVANS